VLGLPAIVVVSPDGKVVEEARITSFVPPEQAVQILRRAGLRPVQADDRVTGLVQTSMQEEHAP
jgi:hypothetical protein